MSDILKPADACRVVAHLSGRPVSWTEQTARLMRLDGTDLWPQIGKGSRSGTVTARHFANLLIAASAPGAAPFTAVRTVKWLCSLKPAVVSLSVDNNAARDASTLAQIVESASGFGDFLEHIIAALADSMNTPGDTSAHGFADFLAAIKFEIVLQAEADGSYSAAALIGGARVVSFADEGPKTISQGGGGRLMWHVTPQPRARYATFLSWGVLISIAAAMASGRADAAFLSAVNVTTA
jgi:hypothetical protein